MRKVVTLLTVVALSVPGLAQIPNPAPQTARQALIEMFFSKTPGTLVKHLPAATIVALGKSGSLDKLQLYSAMAGQMQTQGHNTQTFETGPVLLASDDPKTGQKVEITVVSDKLRGDRDDIELSFQIYKNGEAQKTPYLPQITFSMKQEEKVWTLNEVSLTLHLPLADPDLLKAFTDGMKSASSTATTTNVSFTPHNETPAQPAGNDAMVTGAMRSILTAEVTYASAYPAVGFACTLSNLDGFGGGEPNEHQAMLISSGLASGKKHGFVFSISDCGGTPARSFHLTAVPNGSSYGRKAFCADQTGVIRSSEDGNAATCLASGVPIQ